MAFGGQQIKGSEPAIQAIASTTPKVRSVQGEIAGKADASINDFQAKGFDPSKPFTPDQLRGLLKDAPPEIREGFAALAQKDSTIPSKDAEIQASTTQSKDTGFDTGFGLYGGQKQAIESQIEESAAKIDGGWDDIATT